MPSTCNRFSVTDMIRVLEREIGRKSQTSDPTGIYGVYFRSRKKVLKEMVAGLQKMAPEDDAMEFCISFFSVLIDQVEERIAYMKRPLTPAVRAEMCGELAGLRVALTIFR